VGYLEQENIGWENAF